MKILDDLRGATSLTVIIYSEKLTNSFGYSYVG